MVQAGINRSRRTRNMPPGLQYCVIASNDVVNDEGELGLCSFHADIEPINVTEALKDPKWINVMLEELKSIEVNKTWSLFELPQGKKETDVKWVYKVKLNPKE